MYYIDYGITNPGCFIGIDGKLKHILSISCSFFMYSSFITLSPSLFSLGPPAPKNPAHPAVDSSSKDAFTVSVLANFAEDVLLWPFASGLAYSILALAGFDLGRVWQAAERDDAEAAVYGMPIEEYLPQAASIDVRLASQEPEDKKPAGEVSELISLEHKLSVDGYE